MKTNRKQIAFNIQKTRALIKFGACQAELIKDLLCSNDLLNAKPKTKELVKIALNSHNCLSVLNLAANGEYLFSNIYSTENFLNAKDLKSLKF